MSGIGRASTLSRRRVPGVAEDGTIIPKEGPYLRKAIIKTKVAALSAFLTPTRQKRQKNKWKKRTKSPIKLPKTTIISSLSSSSAPQLLGELQKLTPRQKQLQRSASTASDYQISSAHMSRRTAMLPKQIPEEEEELTRLAKEKKEISDTSNTTTTITTTTTTTSISNSSNSNTSPIFSTRQQPPTRVGLAKSARSHGSIFASLMSKFDKDLKISKKHSHDAILDSSQVKNIASWVEAPITSCSTSNQLTSLVELHDVQLSNRKNRRSSGFGMSMSCGDGKHAFLMTGTGPIGFYVGG